MKARRLSVLVALAMLLQLFFFTPAGAVRAAPPLDMGINATLVVNSTQDNDDGACDATHCTLREAIHYAASGDMITFAPGMSGQTIVVGSALVITKNLTIDASALPERVKVSGNDAVRVFTVEIGHTVSMNFLEIRDGYFTGDGGGIYNAGTLTLTNFRVVDNAAAFGGGIYNTGTLTIMDSTFDANQASKGGGVLSYGGTVAITGSTFSNNSGAAFEATMSDLAIVTVTNSTFSGTTGGGIINGGLSMTLQNVTIRNSTGRGIYNKVNSTLHFINTVVAGSVDVDCLNDGGTIATNSHNLVEDGTCSAALSGDPLLEPLADNGGPTQTHALLPGSPAIDAGDPANCPATDQRGVSRPKDGNADGTAVCDIGAVEMLDTDPHISGSYALGGLDQVTFTFTVHNPGAGAADGAQVSIPLPATISNASWSCAPSGGATCGSGGTGDVLDTISAFPAGSTVIYTITATYERMQPFQVTGALLWAYDPNKANNQVELARWVVILPTIYNNTVP